ncbi:MAG: TetR/AcrR family transcriptional regulator [Deltaproteobacteria bacterium]|jgi:AcrR family transcriptional regulator|nr:TetR/AcrR family transcriptional regulator [Deltaproteobacteria bacterium]
MIQLSRKEEKRALIIEAAAKVFARRGFASTLMAEIAIEAGIGKGTLYEYFDSKENLFFAVFEWFVQATEAEAKVSISALGGSASERLDALSDSLMSSWAQMEDMYSLVMEFWSASASSQMRERFKQAFKNGYSDFRQIVSTLIRDGIERGEFQPQVDIDSVAAALVGTWDALLLQAWFDDDFNPLTAARGFMTVVINGLTAKPQVV